MNRIEYNVLVATGTSHVIHKTEQCGIGFDTLFRFGNLIMTNNDSLIQDFITSFGLYLAKLYLYCHRRILNL